MLRPLGNRVIIEPITEDKSKGGIYFAYSITEYFGKIISISSEADISTFLKVGDIVLYPQFGAIPFKSDGKNYLIVKVDDLLAVETNE